MAVQSSFADENVLRAFNILDLVIPPSARYETPFIDVSRFTSFTLAVYNDNITLAIDIRWSVDGTSDIEKSFDIPYTFFPSVFMASSQVLKVKAKYLKIVIDGTPFQKVNLQSVFYETPPSTQLNNVGGGTEVYVAGTEGDIKTLIAGTGINIIDSSTEITIEQTGPVSSIWYEASGVIQPITVSTSSIVSGQGNTIDVLGARNLIGGCLNTSITGSGVSNAIIACDTSDINTLLNQTKNNVMVGSINSNISPAANGNNNGIYSCVGCEISGKDEGNFCDGCVVMSSVNCGMGSDVLTLLLITDQQTLLFYLVMEL
jgi:hypothetical protein